MTRIVVAPQAPVRAGPSRIDGIGAFATAALPARRKIGEMDGEIVSLRTARQRARGRERIHIVEFDDGTALDGTRGASPLKYANHSCRPNVYIRLARGRVEFYALRAIAAGEELTADYGETQHEGKLRCRCSAPGCIGFL